MSRFEGASLQDTCELVGLPKGKKVFAEYWPIPESSDQVVRLARKLDSSCIYVRLATEES